MYFLRHVEAVHESFPQKIYLYLFQRLRLSRSSLEDSHGPQTLNWKSKQAAVSFLWRIQKENTVHIYKIPFLNPFPPTGSDGDIKPCVEQ